MNAALRFLERERNWPLVAVVVGALVLLPRIGTYGFWEPQEIEVADRARQRLERYPVDDITKAVTTHYRVRIADIRAGKQGGTLDRARDVIVYLARKHSKETRFDLKREFRVDVDSAVKRIEEQLKGQTEAELSADLEAIEGILAEREDKAGRRQGARRGRGSERGPPFTEWIIAQGIDKVSRNELGTRLPLALLGLIALAATFFLGRRLAGARAGLLAAAVLITFPLFVFQSRQLNSDIGAVAGGALMMLGLLGLAWPSKSRRGRRLLLYPVDAALIGLGAVISYYAAGALLGLFAPLGAVAFACLLALIADRGPAAFTTGELEGLSGDEVRRKRRSRLWHLLVVGVLATAAALTVFLVVFFAIFDLSDPIPGGRALFGKSVVPTTDYVEALGGTWRPSGDLKATFDVLFEQIAYGMFPWGVLAPIALIHLAMGARGGRRSWGGYAVFGWALFTWVVATVMARKVGPVHYPALVAVAVAVGMWLDDLLGAREHAEAEENAEAEARRRFGVLPRLPLVAAFAALAALVLAKDLQVFADKITSIHVLSSTVHYPKGMALKAGFLVFAILFGAAIALGLWLWARRELRPPGFRRALFYAGRYGIHCAFALGVVFALFLAQVWTPALSRKLSSKHLFAQYHRYKSEGDKLGIMGMGARETGPKYYAGDPYAKLANRNELLDFMKQEGRVFALVPASELCAVHRSAKGTFEYAVLDDSHARFLLLSNKLESGERDRNPLARAILRQPPTGIERPMEVNYDNKIQLIGVNMPHRVGRGDTFTMTLFFKVLKPVGGTWKIFVHFDGGGLRFQGDHEPINGRCGTGFWQPGDYIVDRFKVEAGDMTYAKTVYTARVGFFVGSHGNWRNMKVVSGERDDNDRVPVGTIRLK